MITQFGKTWQTEGERLYGKDIMNWKFKCPKCGYIQTPQEFKDNNIEPVRALSNCIGRHVEGIGCDWAAGGLFRTMGKGRIIKDLETNEQFEIFDFATDEPAKIDDIGEINENR
jgi:hypothetical protein